MVRGGTARDWSISGDEVSLVPQCNWVGPSHSTFTMKILCLCSLFIFLPG